MVSTVFPFFSHLAYETTIDYFQSLKLGHQPGWLHVSLIWTISRMLKPPSICKAKPERQHWFNLKKLMQLSSPWCIVMPSPSCRMNCISKRLASQKREQRSRTQWFYANFIFDLYVWNANSLYCWAKVCLQTHCEMYVCARWAVHLFKVTDIYRDFSSFSSNRNFCVQDPLFKTSFPCPCPVLSFTCNNVSPLFFSTATSGLVLPNSPFQAKWLIGSLLLAM